MRAGSPNARRREAGITAPVPKPDRIQHNRIEQGRELLGQVEGWSGDRRWIESRLGDLLFRHPGYVPLLRKRLTVTPRSEAVVKAFIEAFPDPEAAFAQGGADALRGWLQKQGINRWDS